uniref:Uncharacterized protein n=1 Tax=Heterorhabditis bacteriophora TaxID=37862 RepID=A0A1I7W832_HETBA
MPKKTDRYPRIMDLAITRPAQELVLNCHTGHGNVMGHHFQRAEKLRKRLSSYLVVEREERPRPVARLSLALREADYSFLSVVFIVCFVGATMLVESELGLLYTVASRIKELIVHCGAPDSTRGHNSLQSGNIANLKTDLE